MIKMLTFSTQIPPCSSTTRYNTEMGNKDNQMKERKTPRKTPKKDTKKDTATIGVWSRLPTPKP